MSQTLSIDFISDIACPWCVVGLYSLEKALQSFPGIETDFKLHPYELDPAVGPEGENLLEAIEKKYDSPPSETRKGLAQIAQRGAEVGFVFNFNDDSRTWNTFDAHRMMYWSGLHGTALPMKKALFAAYFTHNRNPGDYELLVRLAEETGLDGKEALRMLESGAYTEEVRSELALWKERGVNVVPTIRLQGKQTFTGAQTVATFEQAIRSALSGSYSPGAPLM